MSWYDDQPVVTPPAAPEPAPSIPRANRLRRGVVIAGLGALLLVGGGVAVVSAASPEPSTEPSVVQPDATTQPDATAQPERVGPNGERCPDKIWNGGNGTNDGGSGSNDDSDGNSPSTDL